MQSINSICESMFNSINVLLADIYNGLSFGGVADKSFCKTLVEAQWQIVNDFRYSLVFWNAVMFYHSLIHGLSVFIC